MLSMTFLRLRPQSTVRLAQRTLWSSRVLLEKSSNNNKYNDPFPNLAIRHSPEMDIETPYPNLPPIPRPNESQEKKLARLVYQSRKRGILETDLLLSTFSQRYLHKFSLAELEEYDKLLDEPDWDIFYWATAKKERPDRWKKSKILDMVCEHSKNKEKKVLRMPDL
ncbi:Flavinator of succinate dehydrogenase-domain-containing protein [Gongronella butleri]|nr:Flavinator of succinate dehydrogenase-domain-containing protein [Gongronella butleri]